jgi:transposase
MKAALEKHLIKSPIVGLGLLLVSHQIPIGMKMYPGNESEKPVLRDVIDHFKKQNIITGKTIHVADKGLNCAQNIAYSKTNGDGYLFSKSVKGNSTALKKEFSYPL